MEKVLFMGDIHGDFYWINNILEVERPDVIVQLGDFGFWEHTEKGVYFLDGVSARLVDTETVMFFIDGNHENHDMLVDYNDGASHGYDPVEIRPNLLWMPRGSILELDNGTKLGALGGAPSVDKGFRRKGFSWWPGEEIADEDADFAINHFFDVGIDIMLSHDGPCHITLDRLLGGSSGFKLDRWMQDRCDAHRQRVGDIWDASGAKTLIHGHYHRKVTTQLDDERMVYGLSQEQTRGNVMWLGDVL